MGVITFNGVPSTDVGIVVEHYPDYQYPEKVYESSHVPGRNGDVLYEPGEYRNTYNGYQIAFMDIYGRESFPEMAENVSRWLHSSHGYVRLSDTYTPNVYYIAYYKEQLALKNLLNKAGRATIKFERKPQRFLVSGDEVATFTANGTITNPTNEDSKPIISVYGTGSGVLLVGSTRVEISNIDGYVTINSELQDSYKGASDQNGVITLPGNAYPILVPGDNGIEFSGGITSVEIIPKWWMV